MRLVYLMSELLQEGYYMPSRLKEERIQHMHECLHESLHSFQHYAAYRKIYPQHGVGEELIDKDVKDQGPISSIKFVRYILNCAYVVF